MKRTRLKKLMRARRRMAPPTMRPRAAVPMIPTVAVASMRQLTVVSTRAPRPTTGPKMARWRTAQTRGPMAPSTPARTTPRTTAHPTTALATRVAPTTPTARQSSPRWRARVPPRSTVAPSLPAAAGAAAAQNPAPANAAPPTPPMSPRCAGRAAAARRGAAGSARHRSWPQIAMTIGAIARSRLWRRHGSW